MVVDEFGTVVGLVTAEDAVEQIVGEIREEHEKPQPAESRPPGEPIEIDGITPILDLASQNEIELPYDAGFETLAGFLMSRLGHIPNRRGNGTLPRDYFHGPCNEPQPNRQSENRPRGSAGARNRGSGLGIVCSMSEVRGRCWNSGTTLAGRDQQTNLPRPQGEKA